MREGLTGLFPSEVVDASVPPVTFSRHLPVLRQCVGSRETPLILACCARTERRHRPPHSLLLLTRSRLVITTERGLLHRLRLHLNLDLNQLADVAWSAEPERCGLQFAATAVDGVREHFWIRLSAADRVWWLDALLRDAFAVTALPSEPLRPATRPAETETDASRSRMDQVSRVEPGSPAPARTALKASPVAA